MENYRKYVPVTCWKCGKMNNSAATKICVECGIYLKTSANDSTVSNLHNGSIFDHPAAKSFLILGVIFVVFLTAGLLVNSRSPSFLSNLSFSFSSDKKTDTKPDTPSVKTNLYADKLNKTYVPLKKGNLTSSSWYKNSWWSYVRKYPSAQQIFAKNIEASGRMITIEQIQSIHITGNLSVAETKCYDEYCENNVVDPNTYSNPTLSFDTLNDYLNKSYVNIGDIQIFGDKSGKFFRIATLSGPNSSQAKKIQVKEVFNGVEAWRQTATFDANGLNPAETFEKLDNEKTEALKKEMQTIWKNATYDNDAEVLGVADVGEGTSFVVKSKDKDRTMYFDTVSGLITRDDRDDMTAFFADFRMMEDSMVPYLMYFRKGRPSHDNFSWMRLEISDWKLNGEYDDSIFTMPEK